MNQTELADLRNRLGALLDLEFCEDVMSAVLDGVERQPTVPIWKPGLNC